LDLVINFYQEKSNYEKGVIIRTEFWTINDFILRNWGACVDTVFWHESRRTNRQSKEYCVELIGRLPVVPVIGWWVKDVAGLRVETVETDRCRLNC